MNTQKPVMEDFKASAASGMWIEYIAEYSAGILFNIREYSARLVYCIWVLTLFEYSAGTLFNISDLSVVCRKNSETLKLSSARMTDEWTGPDLVKSSRRRDRM